MMGRVDVEPRTVSVSPDKVFLAQRCNPGTCPQVVPLGSVGQNWSKTRRLTQSWQLPRVTCCWFPLTWNKIFLEDVRMIFFFYVQMFTPLICFAQPQSCPTLWDPMDCSLPGSSVHGIFQARILEWVARCLFCHIINICLWQIIRTKQWKIIMNLLLLKL